MSTAWKPSLTNFRIITAVCVLSVAIGCSLDDGFWLKCVYTLQSILNFGIWLFFWIYHFFNGAVSANFFLSCDYHEGGFIGSMLYNSLYMTESIRLYTETYQSNIQNNNISTSGDIFGEVIIDVPEIEFSDLTPGLIAEVTQGFLQPVVLRNVYDKEWLLNEWNIDKIREKLGDRVKLNLLNYRYPCQTMHIDLKYENLTDHDNSHYLCNKKSIRLKEGIDLIKNRGYHEIVHQFLTMDDIEEFEVGKNLKNGTFDAMEFGAVTAMFISNTYQNGDDNVNEINYKNNVNRTYQTGSKLHAAPVSNLNINIFGRKIWTFIDPKYSIYLRPTLQQTGLVSYSFVEHILYDMNDPEFNAELIKSESDYNSKFGDTWMRKRLFPDRTYDEYVHIKNVWNSIPKIRTIVDIGDVLYIPPWYWHTVSNLPSTIDHPINGNNINIAIGHRSILFRHAVRNNFPFAMFKLAGTPWDKEVLKIYNVSDFGEGEKGQTT